MTGEIWVLAEQWRGRVSEITYENLALGRELADALDTPLAAILLGSNSKALAATLGKADRVLYADHPRLGDPIPQDSAEALAGLAKEHKPRAILVPLTNVGLGVGSFVAARLQVPVVNFCKDVRVRDGRLEASCVMYGGKIESTVAPLVAPAVLGMWPGARQAEKGRSEASPAVEEVQVVLGEAPALRLKRYIEPETGDVDLARQDVLIAVGRGIQGCENISMAEELAQALAGAVCASRPVIDQGWLPVSRQIGKSGLAVNPKLYVALGISGAPEHVEGMKNSGLIVAVNTDPQAPIFNVAHYGIVGDALELLPALTAAVARRKSHHA